MGEWVWLVRRRAIPCARSLSAFSKLLLTTNLDTPSMYGPTTGCSLTRKGGALALAEVLAAEPAPELAVAELVLSRW